jgi:hypothetical protein
MKSARSFCKRRRWLRQKFAEVVPLGLLCAVLALALPCTAQIDEFLPEVDAYYKLDPDIRLDFQAKQTREAGDPTQAEIGPSIDFFMKPLLRLKDVTVFDLDESKGRPLVLSAGFRYVPSGDKPTVYRIELEATPHLPLFAKILLTDRNRADLDWSSSPFVWRYRNRLDLERSFAIRSYHLSPYIAAEAFYQSQYHKWSTTALYVGCLFPMGKHFELDPYYEHQNFTGKHPNVQYDQLGLILNIFINRQKP